MTRRQIRVAYLLAVLIAIAGIVSVVIGHRRTVVTPVEVGVIAPEHIEADTASIAPEGKSAAKRKCAVTTDDTGDHRDSPLYHATPRDDMH